MITFPDEDVAARIARFYRTFYKQKQGSDAHPEVRAHVSVDNEEREKAVNDLLAKGNGVVVAKRIELKKVGDKEVIFAVDK